MLNTASLYAYIKLLSIKATRWYLSMNEEENRQICTKCNTRSKKKTHLTSLRWWVLQLVCREDDVQRDQFEWNLDSTEIKCNPEQAWDFSLCLKKWHISNTTIINERTLGCFSRNVKKLKPILMSLHAVPVICWSFSRLSRFISVFFQTLENELTTTTAFM